MSRNPIRIATRVSRLAVWQAEHVAELLRAVTDRDVELVHVSTAGDRDQSASLSRFGSVGVFTRAVQQAVLDGAADVAVHSLKDLPTDSTPGLLLAAVPKRGPRFDALVLPKNRGSRVESRETDALDSGLSTLDSSARVGTGSPRRRAQLLHQRSDLELLDVRGNVETRLTKLDDGDYDALILAEAGLKRLGLGDRISVELSPPVMYPAVGQGALGLECRADDDDIRQFLQAIADPATLAAVTAERALLAELRAGCHAPVGVFTTHTPHPSPSGDQPPVGARAGGEGRLTLEAVVLSLDGQTCLFASVTGPAEQPATVGQQAAEDLFRQGAAACIERRAES